MSEQPVEISSTPSSRPEIMAWRKSERARLIEARLALPASWRAETSSRLIDRLSRMVGDVRGKRISLYWPLKGEPDLRPWMKDINEAGGQALLPVVAAPKTPLVFKPWREGEPLEKGVWNIPIPVTSETAVPDICLAPVVGFDRRNYRLGYGGGFFDRTLAGFERKPMVIGIGYAMQAIDTIYPFDHDIPMDVIVTEKDDEK